MNEDEPKLADTPTHERLAKAGDAVEEFITESGRRTLRLLDGSTLNLLLNRGVLSGEQYHAGARYYSDWYYAGLSPGAIDTTREAVDGGQHPGQTDRKLDALTNWNKAKRALGVIHSHVIDAVVLQEMPLVEYGWRMSRRKDDKDARLEATSVLKVALSALDYHYHGKRRGHYRESHQPDYRPKLAATG